MLEKLNLFVPSLDSPYTKVGPAANESDIRTQTKKKADRMLHRPDDQTDNQAYQHRLNLPDLHILLVVAKSGLE